MSQPNKEKELSNNSPSFARLAFYHQVVKPLIRSKNLEESDTSSQERLRVVDKIQRELLPGLKKNHPLLDYKFFEKQIQASFLVLEKKKIKKEGVGQNEYETALKWVDQFAGKDTFSMARDKVSVFLLYVFGFSVETLASCTVQNLKNLLQREPLFITPDFSGKSPWLDDNSVHEEAQKLKEEIEILFSNKKDQDLVFTPKKGPSSLSANALARRVDKILRGAGETSKKKLPLVTPEREKKPLRAKTGNSAAAKKEFKQKNVKTTQRVGRKIIEQTKG